MKRGKCESEVGSKKMYGRAERGREGSVRERKKRKKESGEARGDEKATLEWREKGRGVDWKKEQRSEELRHGGALGWWERVKEREKW